MRLARVSLPPGEGEGVAISFPSSGSAGPGPVDAARIRLVRAAASGRATSAEPTAFLSFASAGDMKFLEPSCVANRERFLKAAGLGSSRALGLELSHSRRVLLPAPGTEADAASRGFDGLLLRDSSFAATVTVADCMPIWLLDRGSGAFGVLHSGWRGTGILLEALRVLASAGSDPAGIAVVLGPAIGRCCYEVQDERAAAFRGEFGAECVQVRGGLCHLDLRAANVSIAAAAGVGSLLSIEACTSCDHRLGSFRRQGASSFTRMLAAVGAPEAP